jgi:hypothetical protein
MTTVTLYTKPDCCLCDEAMAVIERVRRSVEFDLERVDISQVPDLSDRYGERIPVVLVDGIELFEYRVEEEVLRSIVEDGPRRTTAAVPDRTGA